MQLDSVQMMYMEMDGIKHLTRITGRIKYPYFHIIATTDTIHFEMNYKDGKVDIISRKTWAKSVKPLKDQMLDIIDMGNVTP